MQELANLNEKIQLSEYPYFIYIKVWNYKDKRMRIIGIKLK